MAPELPVGTAIGARLGIPGRWDIVDKSLLALLFLRPVTDITSRWSVFEIGRRSTIVYDALNPAGFLSLAAIAVAGGLIVRAVMRKRLRVPLVVLLYALLAVWAACTLAWSEDLGVGLAHSLRLGSIAAFAYLACRVCRHQDGAARLWRIIALSSVVPAAVGLYQFSTGTGDTTATTGLSRSFGTFVHPNPFGHYLALAVLANYGWLSLTRARRIRLRVGLAGLQVSALIVSFSRGAWLEAVVALGVVGLFGKKRAIRPTLILLGAVAVVIVSMNWSAVSDRFGSLLDTDQSRNTALGRTAVWAERLGYALPRPMGSGIGSANLIAERNGAIAAGTHNDHLRVLLELGIVGLVLWLAVFLAGLGKYASLLWAGDANSARRATAVVGLAALAAYFSGAWVENLLTTTAYQWDLWALLVPALVVLRRPGGAWEIGSASHTERSGGRSTDHPASATATGERLKELPPQAFTRDYFRRQYAERPWRSRGGKPVLHWRWVRTLRSIARGSGWLVDVGCGEGDFALMAQGRFRHVLALDVSRDGVVEAKRKGCANLLRASASSLPIADASVEVLVALDVVEHLSSPSLFFTEAARVLVPNGILALSTPNPESLGARWKGPAWFGFRDSTHVSILRTSEWRTLLADHGFDVVDDGTDTLWDVPYWSMVPAGLQRAFFIAIKQGMHLWDVKFRWTLGENYVCIARRADMNDPGRSRPRPETQPERS